MTEILVVGMAALDIILSVETFPAEPTKYRADDARLVGGGMAASAAVAIARLGATPRLAARLGSDPLAQLILGDLEAEGVSTGLIKRTQDGRSAFSTVLVDRHGERQLVNFRGAGLSEATDWIAALRQPEAVLVDVRWPEAAAEALAQALVWGVPGILDGEAPIPPELLERASHIAFSRQGLASVAGDGAPAKALERYARDAPGWACVTDGANGVWFTNGGGIDHAPAFKVAAKDTLGAGDVWHGAFALALAEGQAEAEAIRFANAAAALKCRAFGGRAGAPSRDVVERLLEENR